MRGGAGRPPGRPVRRSPPLTWNQGATCRVDWTEDGTPLVLSLMSRKFDQDAVREDELIAETAEVLAGALG